MNTITNEAIIRKLYHYFSLADYENIKQLFHPDIIWEQMQGFPNGGVYKGGDAIIQLVFNGFKDEWEGWKAVTESFIEAGEYVFAVGYYEGRYKRTGKEMKADYLHKYELRQGQIIHFKQYTDTHMLVDAMQA